MAKPVIIYSSPKKIEKFFRYVYGDLFDDPHAADDVRSIAHGRTMAKLRLIQAKQQPKQKELKVALEVVNMCCHECWIEVVTFEQRHWPVPKADFKYDFGF